MGVKGEEDRKGRKRSEERMRKGRLGEGEDRSCEKGANKGGWNGQTRRNSGTIYSEELLASRVNLPLGANLLLDRFSNPSLNYTVLFFCVYHEFDARNIRME